MSAILTILGRATRDPEIADAVAGHSLLDALIESSLGGRAEVAVKRQSACGHDCSKCGGGCSELMVSSTVAVIAANPVRAMPGDMVTVESSTSRVLGAAVIVYLVPFLLFFAGYFLCAAFRLSSGVSAAVGVAGFALGLLLAVLWDRRVRRQQAISFCITAIAPEA